jgi:hypothetical protein
MVKLDICEICQISVTFLPIVNALGRYHGDMVALWTIEYIWDSKPLYRLEITYGRMNNIRQQLFCNKSHNEIQYSCKKYLHKVDTRSFTV